MKVEIKNTNIEKDLTVMHHNLMPCHKSKLVIYR